VTGLANIVRYKMAAAANKDLCMNASVKTWMSSNAICQRSMAPVGSGGDRISTYA